MASYNDSFAFLFTNLWGKVKNSEKTLKEFAVSRLFFVRVR